MDLNGSKAEPAAKTRDRLNFVTRNRWAMVGLAVVAMGSYAGWRFVPRGASLNPPAEPLIYKYINAMPFTYEGFSEDDAFVPDAINSSVRLRLEAATRTWPNTRFQPWQHLIRT